MKLGLRCLVSVLLLFVCLTVYGQDQLEIIRKEYYENYATENGYPIKFAKKKDDWYISAYDFNKQEYDLYLFWDEKKEVYTDLSKLKEFKSIDYFSSEGPNNLPSIGSFQRYLYGIMPYYKYRGWHKDNIKYFRGRKLTLDDHYVLARSYSSYSMSFLADQYASSDKADLPDQDYIYPGEATAHRMKAFIEKSDSALYHYEKIVEQNPRYDTRIVGTVKMKWANEKMFQALTLDMYSKKGDVYETLPEEMYSQSIVNYSKRFLDACPQNAILFVEGDNDTYPLLYVRNKLNYRKDITIINRSLLGLAIYSNHLKEEQQLRTSLTYNHKTYKNLSYARRNPTDKDSCSLHELLGMMHKSQNKRDNMPLKYSCKYLTIDSITVLLRNNYMFRNELNELDIINENKDERPICYSLTCDSSRLMGAFMPYAMDRGTVILLQFSNPKLTERFDVAFIQRALENDVLKHATNTDQYEWFEVQSVKSDLLRWLIYLKDKKSYDRYAALYELYKSLILKHEFSTTSFDLLIFNLLLERFRNQDVEKEFTALKRRVKKVDFYHTSNSKLLPFYSRIKRKYKVK